MTDVRGLPGGAGGPAVPYVRFEYALLRAVPRIDRGECANVGVVLYCQARDYLGTLLHVDEVRLRSLDPAVDVDAVRAADRSQRERFGWLTAPRSTVVQAGPVHSGLTRDPDADLRRLLDRLVR